MILFLTRCWFGGGNNHYSDASAIFVLLFFEMALIGSVDYCFTG